MPCISAPLGEFRLNASRVYKHFVPPGLFSDKLLKRGANKNSEPSLPVRRIRMADR